MTVSVQGTHWYGLVGAPADVGNFRCGAAQGPDRLREAGLVERLARHGVRVEDQGNVAGPTYDGIVDHARCRSLAATAAWCASVRDACSRVLGDGGMPLLIGGDHSLVLGSIAASAAKAKDEGRPLWLFWFDAHPDFNTPETTPSGNTHGLPAASACGIGHPAMLSVGAFTPLLSPRNLHQFGIRDVDSGERANLVAAGVNFHEMPAVRQHGLSELVARALEAARRADALVHVSFDMDGLDPSIAPGVGTPVPNGLMLDEAQAAVALIGESGLLCGFDLVEFAPERDQRDKTALAALALLDALTAAVARGNAARRARVA